MLNRYGHYVSYTATEELETEQTNTFTSASKISPPDLVPGFSLVVGIAYDNFNQFLETLTGKETLHDTVHIVHQSVSEETFRAVAIALENRSSASGDSTSRRKGRKKSLKVLVWTSSLIIRSQNYQALN